MSERLQRRTAAVLAVIAAVMAVCLYWFCLRPEPVPELALSAPAAERLAAGAGALDLNDATADELICLPGIGPALAEAILTRREELGAFRTKEDVLSVRGIGEATYEKILPYITF